MKVKELIESLSKYPEAEVFIYDTNHFYKAEITVLKGDPFEVKLGGHFKYKICNQPYIIPGNKL